MKKYLLYDVDENRLVVDYILSSANASEIVFTNKNALSDVAGHYICLNVGCGSLNPMIADFTSNEIAMVTYLATFVGRNNAILHKNGKPMQRNDIVKITGNDIITKLIDNKVISWDGQQCVMNQELCISYYHPDENKNNYVNVYKKHYQKLYEAASSLSERRAIGNIIRLLVHADLSSNKGIYLRMDRKEIAQAITGKDVTNPSRYISELCNLTYEYHNLAYTTCIYQRKKENCNVGLYISPFLFYRGNDIVGARNEKYNGGLKFMKDAMAMMK